MKNSYEQLLRYSETDCAEYYFNIVKKAVASQNGITYLINNKSNFEILKLQYDGCIPEAKSGGCDFIFFLRKELKYNIVLVELKNSSQFGDAITQINRTLDKINLNKSIISIYGRAALAGVPNYYKTQDIKLDKRLRQLNGNFKKSSGTRFEENY